jgi:hypothetical protein
MEIWALYSGSTSRRSQKQRLAHLRLRMIVPFLPSTETSRAPHHIANMITTTAAIAPVLNHPNAHSA